VISGSNLRKTGLLLFAGALFAAVPAVAGYAQSADTGQLISRINELENQVQTLSRSVYRGAPPPAMAAPVSGGGGDAAVYEQRISQLEQQQRDLTGQVEQAQHQAQDALNRLDKIQADYDARLQRLEGGAPAPTPVPQAYTAPAPAPATPEHTLGELPANSAADTPDALYESAFADVRDSKYDAAEGKLRLFLSKYPDNALAGNAEYWLGETYYVRADYKQAAKVFAKGYQDYPKGSKAADSLLKLGLSLSKLGKKEDACLSFQQLKKEFPGETVPANRRAAQEMKTLGCT
jgi:tol-pal system protein YbgF